MHFDTKQFSNKWAFQQVAFVAKNEDTVMAFSGFRHMNIAGCLLKKNAYKVGGGEVMCTPGHPPRYALKQNLAPSQN